MKLAQANTELPSRYAWSPDVAGEVVRSMQMVFEQAQASFARLAGSQAFIGLVQGLMKNYADFLADLAQSGYAVMSEGQLPLMQRVQDATSNVVGRAARGGRSR